MTRIVFLGILLSSGLQVWGQPAPSPRLQEMQRSTARMGTHTYTLHPHRYAGGETLYYEVIHQSAVETKVEGNSERVKSRSKSLKKLDFGPQTGRNSTLRTA